MSLFEKEKPEVIINRESFDFSGASFSSKLSIADFNDDEKYFYITVDKVLFTSPVDTIRSVLEAHGYVSNLENILSCLDSLLLCVYGRVSSKNKKRISGNSEKSLIEGQVSDYLPCFRFELPQKNKIGEVLQFFYDELEKYESRAHDKQAVFSGEMEALKNQSLKKEIKQLKKDNAALSQQVSLLTQQLTKEQKSLNRASRALDMRQMLPENTHICTVEDIDLKKRIIKVKFARKQVDVPTYILDRVPDFKSRCLVTFDENEEKAVGVLFLDNQELGNIEKRSAELLHVEGNTFKARDSERNEFQISALNNQEAIFIQSLKRGMRVLISIADNYVVRFSELDNVSSNKFVERLDEQLVVYEIGRNQLVGASESPFDVEPDGEASEGLVTSDLSSGEANKKSIENNNEKQI